MATQATLHWIPFVTTTPANAGVVSGQRIEYRDTRVVSNVWQAAPGLGTLSPTLDSAQVTDLLPDIPYEFRVVTVCSAGETPTSSVTGMDISCPTLVVTPGISTLAVTLTPASTASNVSAYVVKLLSANGNVTIATKTLVPNGRAPINQTFSLLTGDTGYQLQVTVTAGSFQKDCPLQSTRTLVDPSVSCPAPTSVTAVVTA